MGVSGMIRNAAAACAWATMAHTAHALPSVLWDQSNHGIGIGPAASTTVPLNDFVLDAPSSITGLRVWMRDNTDGALVNPGDGIANGVFTNFSGVLSWYLFADDNSAPGALLHSGDALAPQVVDTGLDAWAPFLDDIFEVTVTFAAPLNLAAGRTWLGVREGLRGSAMDGTEVLWMSTPGQQGAARWYFLDGQNLADLQGPAPLDAAFQILGTQQVPEPGTGALALLALLMALAVPLGKARAATVHLADIVAAPAAVMDFEDAPNLFNGAVGRSSNGIRIQQIGGDGGNDIWSASGLGNGRAWYPDGGDEGWTRIRRVGGANFDAVSFFGGSGWITPPQTLYFELADDGAVVLSGTLAASFGGSWFGFAGGDFDELRIRASQGWVTGLLDCPSGGPGGNGGCNAAWVDDIRVGTALLPLPSSAALAVLALLLMGPACRASSRGARARRAPWLAAAWVLVPLAAAQAQEPVRALPAAAFSTARFEAAMDRQMATLPKGWSFAVADRHGVRAQGAGGWAQAPGDGDVVMTSSTASGMGSVTKMLSGAALLHLLEQRKLSPLTVAQQLDKPMLVALPPKWQGAWPGRNLERITFRHLLQHRSGFRTADCGGANLDALAQMAAGVETGDVGQLDCYNNHNYYLLRYVIATLAYPEEVRTLDQRFRDRPLAEYTEVFNRVSSNLFERFVQRELLPLSKEPLLMTCRPYQLPNKAVAKGYGSAQASEGALLRTEASHRAAGNYCASQGSWYASAQTLAEFGRTLMLSDRWLTASTQTLMYEPARWREAFPWAGTVNQAELGTTFGQSRLAYHGGAEGGYRAALVLLPDGHVAAALANSPMQPTQPNEQRNTSLRLAQALADAFAEATRDRAASPAPEDPPTPR